MFLTRTSLSITFLVRQRLNQLIQFYSNNAINLHHLITHSTTVFDLENGDRIVTIDM